MSDTGSSPVRRSGGCQCGAVRFSVSGVPEEVSVCDCRMCQKAGGGPFLAFARFPAAAISWTRGQPALFHSSTVAVRGFCAACGTPLTFQWRPDAVSLTTGAFDEPAGLAPATRLGTEGRLAWTDGLAGLPSRSADEWLGANPDLKGRFRNHQHPDRDT